MSLKTLSIFCLTGCGLLLVTTLRAPAEEYYTEPPQFHFTPDPTAARNEIGRLGPIGLGLELRQPAFTMYIKTIEKGSPAASTGKLKVGQIIETINGETLHDIDPRVQLGNLITRIEATDGKVVLMIRDTPEAPAYPVEFSIPVLGSYSPTWPVDCEKSDAIVRHFADWLGRQKTLGWGAALFLLSTGEEKDLDVLRRRWSGKLGTDSPGFPWSIGYTGPAICEYYLRTGDESVLPAIKSRCDYLKRTIYNGSWMGRGGSNYSYMAGGHMNAAGVHCLTFLLMAKECGVDVDEHTLQSALLQFYRYVGHGNVPYGDGLPEGGFTDNGRVGGLAFAMQAAANLVPDGENSVYAKARDISATKSFYSTSWLFHGHTGGGIGELWRGPAMGLVKDKRSLQYRTFMDERRWMYELARTYEGAFGWAPGTNVNYTGVNTGKPCGNYIPLVYTLPRKKLRLFGAPPTKYSHTYALPKRPWGTAADDVFFSLEAGEYAPGKRLDVSKEKLRTDASKPIMDRLKAPDVPDETLLAYALHIDQGIRSSAAGRIAALGRYQLVLPLLKSSDPRGRLSGLQVLLGRGKNKGGTDDKLTDEMIQLAFNMVNDPEESWWVVERALRVVANADAELIYANVDRLADWLKHDEWYLRRAALIAVTPIAGDERCYRKVLPIIGKMISTNERAVALSPVPGVVAQLKKAPPEVQEFAVATLGEAYSDFPDVLAAPGGQDMSSGTSYLLDHIARFLANAPGGLDELYTVSKKRFPQQALPHKKLYLTAHPDDFGPKVKQAYEPLVLDYLIPQYMGDGNHIASNREYLLKEAQSIPVKPNYYYRSPRMDNLVWLYQRIGIDDYDWRYSGPGLTEIKWQYLSFDPPEKKIWEPGWRYREVTVPKGMENWFKPEFDAQAAGWKTGHAPFANVGGKMVAPRQCDLPFCRCDEPPQTFWEKEVLLLRTQVKFPPFKEGHRYRLCVGGMSHVNAGDGHEVYINGKRVKKRKDGVGKRAGARPECYYIPKELWPAFEKSVTISAKAFLSIPPGRRSRGVPCNTFSIFLQEMKVPPLKDEMFTRGRKLQPLRCTAWQATKENEDFYRWDGDFVNNQALIGDWTLIGEVEKIDAFEPGADLATDPRAWLKKGVTIKPEGATGSEDLAWSGDILMDLKKMQALQMTVKPIAGADYLFIEAGGFSTKDRKGWKPDYPADWTPPFYVLKRVK